MGKEGVCFVFREYYAQSEHGPEKPEQDIFTLNDCFSIF